ncbi:putative DD34D transposase [Trichonephila clavipes]|nr:putative DD34D transposase [Trichonephila clavipes]
MLSATKTSASLIEAVSEDRVKLCGHNKSVRFLNEEGVCKQGKAMRQHPKGGQFPQTGPVVENVGKITEIIEIDRKVSSRSITQELKINHETVLNYFRKAGFKKKLDVWKAHQLTPKNMMGRIFTCEALAKRNEIDPCLKRMGTTDEKWVPNDSIVRKRSWSKRGEVAQTVTKSGLITRKVLPGAEWGHNGHFFHPYNVWHQLPKKGHG